MALEYDRDCVVLSPVFLAHGKLLVVTLGNLGMQRWQNAEWRGKCGSAQSASTWSCQALCSSMRNILCKMFKEAQFAERQITCSWWYTHFLIRRPILKTVVEVGHEIVQNWAIMKLGQVGFLE